MVGSTGSTHGLFHLSPLCFHLALAATLSTDESRHVTFQIDAHGSAVPRALMRQEDQNTLSAMPELDSPQDTLWGRFFGTGSASVPDVLAVPAESSALATPATPASASSGNASNASNATSTNTSGNTSGITGTAKTAKTASTNGTNGTKAAKAAKAASTKAVSTSTFGKVAAHIKSLSTQDCKDTWEPEWSSEAAEENCQLWAANGDWGALATAASVKIACEGEWAQAHCAATCGCEVVKGAKLDQAILKLAKGLGLSQKQMKEVTSTLETITSSAKEAVLHVMGTAAVALNKTDALHALTAGTTTAPGPSEASSKSSASSKKSSASTTTTTPAAASDVIAMSHALGFDAELGQQLNATLQLIPKQHYDDILEVLKSIERAQTSTTTTTHASVEDIIEIAQNIGLKTEDIAMMNKTLSHIKPEWHDEILATVNETAKQIGAERTGKAIIRHLQKLSWPSREKLPEKDEPNDFAVLVASPHARTLYRQRQGHDARGFYLKVVLPVETLISVIREKTETDVDPRTLSLAISRLEFAWPSTICSNEESGFTDFKLLDFHSGQMVNEGSECGSLVASSIDRNGELRLPPDGNQALFLLAGMFGSKYDNSDGGAEVNLRIAQLVFHEFRDNGDVIEYSMCGRGSLTWKERHFYLGCPKENPLEIVYSDNSLGGAVKLCDGGIPSEDQAIQSNCFEVP